MKKKYLNSIILFQTLSVIIGFVFVYAESFPAVLMLVGLSYALFSITHMFSPNDHIINKIPRDNYEVLRIVSRIAIIPSVLIGTFACYRVCGGTEIHHLFLLFLANCLVLGICLLVTLITSTFIYYSRKESFDEEYYR